MKVMKEEDLNDLKSFRIARLTERVKQLEEKENEYKSENEKLKEIIMDYMKQISYSEETINEYKEVIQSLAEKIAKYEEAEKEPVEYTSQSECDCCGCCDDPDDDFDIEALVIEQQIEIEKLNATIDILLERIV